MKKKKGVPQKRMNPALAAATQQMKDNLFIRSSHKANLLLALMALHNRFGFGEKRLNRFLDEYRNLLEMYNRGEIETVQYFEAKLREKFDIELAVERPGENVFKKE